MKLLLSLFMCFLASLAVSGCEKDSQTSQLEGTGVETSSADIATSDAVDVSLDASASDTDSSVPDTATVDVDVLVFDALVFDVSDAGTDDVE